MWEGTEPRIEENQRKQAAPLRFSLFFRAVSQHNA
jgi:hypothetical protein